MKSVRLIAPVLFAIYLLVAALSWARGGYQKASGDAEEQLKTIETQFEQTALKGDTSFLEKYYADNCTVVHSDGKLTTKAEEIERVKSGALKYESIEVHERNIRFYEDTAVVIKLVSAKGTLDGKPFSGDSRVARFWVKRKRTWKVVAFQVTRVAPSQ
jgi:ketosteroid isomerase-like protein